VAVRVVWVAGAEVVCGGFELHATTAIVAAS
jgi:hypothetical protein